MELCGTLVLWLLALGAVGGYNIDVAGRVDEPSLVGGRKVSDPGDAPTFTWVSFSQHDLELVAKDHQNASVFVIVRGNLSDCIKLNFTYDPSSPSIVPMEDLVICPPGLSTSSTSLQSTSTTRVHSTSTPQIHSTSTLFTTSQATHSSTVTNTQKTPGSSSSDISLPQESTTHVINKPDSTILGTTTQESTLDSSSFNGLESFVATNHARRGSHRSPSINAPLSDAHYASSIDSPHDTQHATLSAHHAPLPTPRDPHHAPTILVPQNAPSNDVPVVWNGSIDIYSRWVGKTILGVKVNDSSVDVDAAFVRVSVIHNTVWDTVSDVFGWIYTVVWDISFLPQVYLNFRRKSVDGLSLDNVSFNMLAYLYYCLFNLAFFTIPLIKAQFNERYPRLVNHVRLNDVFFASWAVLVESVIGVQCLVYHRAPGQVVSWSCRILLGGSVAAVLVACGLAGTHVIWWLDVFYLMSYLKLAITPLKYIPQVYLNYKRKSTEGFSKAATTMDFTGGVMSLAQMMMLSANNDDWLSMITNFSKLGLGVVTLVFDIIILGQYYYYHVRRKQ